MLSKGSAAIDLLSLAASMFVTIARHAGRSDVHHFRTCFPLFAVATP